MYLAKSLTGVKTYCVAASIALLTACGGGGDSGGDNPSDDNQPEEVQRVSLTGLAVKGILASATVTAKSLDGSTIYGTVQTSESGTYSLAEIETGTDPVLVELTTDSDTMATCDSAIGCLNGTVAFGETYLFNDPAFLLTAVLPGTSEGQSDAELMITPLTHIAAKRIASEGAVTPDDITKVNQATASILGLDGVDITQSPPSDITKTSTNSDSAAAKKYGALVAAFATIAAEKGDDDIAKVIDTLAADYADDGTLVANSSDTATISLANLFSAAEESAVKAEDTGVDMGDTETTLQNDADAANAQPADSEVLSDTDGDGVTDNLDAFPLDASETQDSDEDGIGNNADPDDDNDGVNDTEDAFPTDAAETTDTDGDTIGNNADPDDDNDGVFDGEDAFPLDASETTDSDGDGVGDNADVFPDDATKSSEEERDTDGDGTPDVSDTDDDNDGFSDEYEINAESDPKDSESLPVTFRTVLANYNLDDGSFRSCIEAADNDEQLLRRTQADGTITIGNYEMSEDGLILHVDWSDGSYTDRYVTQTLSLESWVIGLTVNGADQGIGLYREKVSSCAEAPTGILLPEINQLSYDADNASLQGCLTYDFSKNYVSAIDAAGDSLFSGTFSWGDTGLRLTYDGDSSTAEIERTSSRLYTTVVNGSEGIINSTYYGVTSEAGDTRSFFRIIVENCDEPDTFAPYIVLPGTDEDDPDADGYTNSEEVAAGSDPYNDASTPETTDSDSDGFSNAEEIDYGSDPYDATSLPISWNISLANYNLVDGSYRSCVEGNSQYQLVRSTLADGTVKVGSYQVSDDGLISHVEWSDDTTTDLYIVQQLSSSSSIMGVSVDGSQTGTGMYRQVVDSCDVAPANVTIPVTNQVSYYANTGSLQGCLTYDFANSTVNAVNASNTSIFGGTFSWGEDAIQVTFTSGMVPSDTATVASTSSLSSTTGYDWSGFYDVHFDSGDSYSFYRQQTSSCETPEEFASSIITETPTSADLIGVWSAFESEEAFVYLIVLNNNQLLYIENDPEAVTYEDENGVELANYEYDQSTGELTFTVTFDENSPGNDSGLGDIDDTRTLELLVNSNGNMLEIVGSGLSLTKESYYANHQGVWSLIDGDNWQYLALLRDNHLIYAEYDEASADTDMNGVEVGSYSLEPELWVNLFYDDNTDVVDGLDTGSGIGTIGEPATFDATLSDDMQTLTVDGKLIFSREF